MDDSIEKEKRWMHLVFLLIGVLSFPISKYLENIFDMPLFQFPFLIYSILYALGLYTFKEHTLIFAFKAFAFSLAASIFISSIGFFLGGAMIGSFLRSLLGSLLGGPIWFYESVIGPMIFFLIVFAVGIYIFKDMPLINSSIKAFAMSYIPLFLITSIWYMPALGGGLFISVQEVQIDQIEKYIELTEEELKEYYLLERSIENYLTNGCPESGTCSKNLWLQSDEYSEYERTRKFVEKKHEDGKLNIYDGKYGDTVFKIDGKYYKFYFGHGD